MITLLMLPFLLAIRTSVNEDGHQYVPVYKYTAQVSIYSLNPMTNLKSKAFSMTGGLKCHPRVPDTLNCRFENTEMRFYQPVLLDLGEESIGAWDMSEEPFEVQFNRQGVRELIVDRSMPPWVIGGLRAIIDQLNIGFDMRGKQDGMFGTKEKSYIGECETLVRINHQLHDIESSWSDNSYEIIVMRGLKKDTGEVLEIVKERNLEECSDDIDPLFGRKGATSTMYGNVPTTMVSSMSRITISDTNYTSFTANDILAKNKHTGESVKLFEEITLKLDSVTTGSFGSSSAHQTGLKSAFDTQDGQPVEGKPEAA